jgi:GntR family transcriptional repressor for pyruvate dehydrogenase complex
MTEHAESVKTWTAAITEHTAILDALQSKDIVAAQTAMRHHLKTSEKRWIEGAQLRSFEDEESC